MFPCEMAFFFQAEDGIRDLYVTGVQTCALPIFLLSEEGHEKVEQLLAAAGLTPPGSSLYDAHNISLVHHLYAALRAHALFHRDQHYVVQNGEVIIVAEFTGRLMPGRRWSDGLHQAVEAKEGVPVHKG